MSPSLPTVVLVPGACHSAACYELLISHLEKAGFPVKALTLPSINPVSPTTATCADDTNFIRNTALLPLVEEGKEILLVGHSYGGIPISAAAFGLSKRTRSKLGKTGGIIGLVGMTALLLSAGKDVMSLMDKDNTPLMYDTPSAGLSMWDDPVKLFYHDLSPEAAARAVDNLVPHAYSAFETPTPPPAWAEEDFRGHFAYIRCTDDAILTPAIQDAMIQSTGVEWIVCDIAASHSPFLSKPEELTEMLKELVKEFQGTHQPSTAHL